MPTRPLCTTHLERAFAQTAVTCALGLGLAGFGAPTLAQVPPDGFHECDSDRAPASCGMIHVPEDPADPAGKVHFPESLFALKHDDAMAEIRQQFDAIYLPLWIQRAGSKARAAEDMGTTTKSLRSWLRNCGLGQ